jgi:NACalpha-BTF3-like transcription factor
MMNEKIKDLMTEAGISVEYVTNTKQIVILEKFAELVIKECASLFSGTFTDEQYQRRIDKTIQKHFGLYE